MTLGYDMMRAWSKTYSRFGSLAALLDDISLMSAFPESGRPCWPILEKFRVRFRPLAVIAVRLGQSASAAICYASMMLPYFVKLLTKK